MIVIPYTTASRNAAVAPYLGRGLDRLFDETLDRVFARPVERPASRTPAMDVSESDTAYTVLFDMPGAVKEQLKVTVEGRKLRVETSEAAAGAPAGAADAQVAEPAAEPSAAAVAAAERALYRERPAARYARSVVLPTEVDQGGSQARFDNGVLTLVLAKRVPSAATQLNIN